MGIYVNIKNGLGNQMFQYALGRKLSILNNCPLKFDFSEYGPDKRNHEGIELNLYRFNIRGEIANENEVNMLIPKNERINNRLFRALSNRYDNQIGKYTFYKKTYINDKWNGSTKVLLAKPPCYLNGVWANPVYCEDILSFLKEELSLKSELKNDYFLSLLKRIKESVNSVGIHFRQKYALYPDAKRFFGVLDLDYYYKGIKYLREKNGGLELFVFADDIGWVKENFKPKQPMTIIEHSEHLTDAHDWELLKNCRYQIISNSTYSWWAARLNPNSQNNVVAPKIWFKNKIAQSNYEKGTFLSNDWIKV